MLPFLMIYCRITHYSFIADWLSMPENADKALVTPGSEFVYTRSERARNAELQKRDRYGRFFAAGANVTWRDSAGDHAGVVVRFEGSNVIVTPNGMSKENKAENVSVPMHQLEVIRAKARLDKLDAHKYHDENDSFQAYFNANSVLQDLDENGSTVTRNDGYSVDITRDEDEFDSSHPYQYQLFGPEGKSLGQYTGLTGAELDTIVSEYEAGQTEVSEDGPTKATIAASGEISVEEPEIKPFRVPDNVRQDVLFALENSNDISDDDFKYASNLAFNDRVSLDDVNWVHQFFDAQVMPQKLRGGYRGNKWASKIITQNTPAEDKPEPVTAGAMFDGETYAYYAIGSEEGSTWASSLLSVNEFTGSVYAYSNGTFELLEDTTQADIEEPNIIPVDDATAEAFATWLSLEDSEDSELNLADIYTEERNLFSLAESEIDHEELNRITAIIADATGYSPLERGYDAGRQRRGPGGTFRDQGQTKPKTAQQSQESSSAPVKAAPAAVQDTGGTKAALPAGLPLVNDLKGRLDEWMAYAPILAAAEAPAEETTENVDPDSTAISEENATYFAIVDDVDKAAVLNVFAITKTADGSPKAWKRVNGVWSAAPDIMAQLQGSSPPPVVELDVPNPAKAVLSQIDQHDSEAPAEDEQATADAGLAASGFALPTGELAILNSKDLKLAVQSFENVDPAEEVAVRNHIRKRAKALNRMDLVPEEWRTATSIERGISLANQSPLYGEYGEVLTASGIPGVADTPEDFKNVARLKAYWKTGAGAAKINWGAPGDLTRCNQHLSKYMPGRAWGYCQSLSIELFGESNYEQDN